MANKSLIYTRGGDAGETSLVSGTRVKKNNLRVDLYGSVDKFNSYMGLAVAYMDEQEKLKEEVVFLKLIQSTMLNIGAILACESDKRDALNLPAFDHNLCVELERRIDNLDGQMPKLTGFIIPGGSKASASLHICRTECRELERKMIGVDEQLPGEIPPEIRKFFNRLSDYLFVLARFAQ